MTLTPRTEEFLSYLQGLAPCGETFEVPQDWFRDIGVKSRVHFYRYLNALIESGHVKRCEPGCGRSTGVLKVVRRLEERRKRPAEIDLAVAGARAFRGAAKEEIAARVAEIPLDTRGLTARICGDPLPGRSALDQRRAPA